MTHCVRLLGAAGTGKTTKSINYIRELAENGLGIDDLLILSFTRMQRDDIRSRLQSVYNDVKSADIEQRVRTIHGAALSTVIQRGLFNNRKHSLQRDTLIVEGEYNAPYVKFCKQYGLKFHHPTANPFYGDHPNPHRYNMPSGNALFALNRYLKANGLKPSDWLNASVDMGISINRRLDIENLLHAWNEWKRQNHLWEHDDYVEVALEHELCPAATTIVIDEFQDVSPSQYALFEMWYKTGAMDDMLVIGDQNQTIYGFRGANPKYLIDSINALGVQDIGARPDAGLFPQSYRCPKEIVEYADRLLRSKSNMLPATHKGHVKEVAVHTPAEFVKYVIELHRIYGQVMILTRYTSNVYRFSKILTDLGVPHKSLMEERIPIWDFVKLPKCDTSKTPNGTTHTRWDMKVVLDVLRHVDTSLSCRNAAGLTCEDVQTLLSVTKGMTIDLFDEIVQPYAISNTLNGSRLQRICDSSQQGESHQTTLADKTPQGIPMLWLTDGVYGKSATMDSIVKKLALPEKHRYALHRVFKNKGKYHTQIEPADIRIDTIHASKGLESPAVILDTGVMRCRQMDPHIMGHVMEEERRVYYVGATRAKNSLVVMNAFFTGNAMSPVFNRVII